MSFNKLKSIENVLKIIALKFNELLSEFVVLVSISINFIGKNIPKVFQFLHIFIYTLTHENMEQALQELESMVWFFPVIALLIIWEMVWKAIGMWKSARNNELGWFIAIILVNSIGILPIVYLILNKNKNKSQEEA